ncbi:MAG: hypothetical protein OCC45_03710 [Desulfotalea sp.]
MNKAIGILFGIACFSTSALSSSIMGSGMWFWIIICVGTFVAASQFVSVLKGIGSGLATILAGISILAVLLGLVAATIGGSFKIDDSSALLLLLFSIIAILGITLGVMFKKSLTAK